MEAQLAQIGSFSLPAIAHSNTGAEVINIWPQGQREQPPAQAKNDLDLIARWLHGRNVNTRKAYQKTAADFLRFAGKPLQRIVLGDLQDFSDSLTHLKASSRNRVMGAIRSLFSFAHKLGYIVFNIGAVLQREDVKDTLAERIITEAEVHRMIVLEPDTRNRVMLRTLYNSGVRVSELCGLRWVDTHEQAEGAGSITVFGKGGKTRTVKLRADVWAELLQLKTERAKLDGPVFLSHKLTPITPCQVWRIVRAAAARAGLEQHVSPHWMRHAHASHSLDRGAPVHVVQATLGHASMATTTLYSHARPNVSSGDYLAG
jgi:integrase/recombinase XerD